MKGLTNRLAGLVSGLLVISVTPGAGAAQRQVIVDPTWSREAIQVAIDTYDVVKFAPGDYPLGYTETAKYYRNAFVITKAVKLMAADARNKPCLYVPEGTEVRVFAVHAPSDATVEIQDLKMGAPWNSHIIRCRTFEIRGCEPVPPDGTPGRMTESFGLWVAPMATMDTGEIQTCEIGQFIAVGNRFKMGGGGYAFYVDPAKFGNDTLNASFVLENNSFNAAMPATILQYGSLKMLNNDFTCPEYHADLLAFGFLVGCDAPESSAMLNHNRVFLEMPKPEALSWGFVQIVAPFSLGSLVYRVGAHNVEIKNTTLSSATADLILPYVMEAWDTHNCVIKGTSYAGLQVLPSGSHYDFFWEEFLAYLAFGTPPLGIGLQDAAEYMFFYSSDVTLLDNNNPEARVLEYPTPGGVRLLGRLQGMQE